MRLNIIELAELQLRRERTKITLVKLLDRAEIIRHWLDIQERNKKVSKNRKQNKLALV